MKLAKAITLITEMLDRCPKCNSDNISNEGSANDSGLEVSCHDCSHQWIDDDRVEQNNVYKVLVYATLLPEAQIIKNMSPFEYREFLKENFDIASLNQ